MDNLLYAGLCQPKWWGWEKSTQHRLFSKPAFGFVYILPKHGLKAFLIWVLKLNWVKPDNKKNLTFLCARCTRRSENRLRVFFQKAKTNASLQSSWDVPAYEFGNRNDGVMPQPCSERNWHIPHHFSFSRFSALVHVLQQKVYKLSFVFDHFLWEIVVLCT